MNRSLLITLLLATPALASCSAGGGGATVVQPGRPGEPSRPVDRVTPTMRAPHTAADVRFMQSMIHHHMQAMEMTALVEQRGAGEAVRTLARRIASSQSDELAFMERWLRARGEPVSPAGGGHTHMPGMLTAEEMRQLAQAGGSAFDRLFIEGMIRHHDGAVAMVAGLFATAGAGEEPEIHWFAQHVDADQRSEIARMRALSRDR